MKWNKPENKKLIGAFLAPENADEMRRFLRDIMTAEEIGELAQRLKAAQMLSQKITYSAIIKKTGLSSTTVARVSKWLNRGQNGYKIVLSRLHRHNRTFREKIGGG